MFSHLVWIHEFGELSPPELHSLLQREPYGLQEKAVLHSAHMTKMVVLTKSLVDLNHAQGE